jgi:hypothetical protein
MSSAVGALSEDERVNSSWLIEGAAVLAWALGLGEPLAHDNQCTPSLVKKQLGFLVPDRLTTPPAPVLRSRKEIVEEFERLWAVHWRLTDYRIHPVPKQFEDLGKRPPFWFGPLATDGIPTASCRNPALALPEVEIPGMVDVTADEIDDLAIRGHAISTATPDDRHQCESIVLERRRALGWVCGLAVRYSDVPMDT